MCDSCGCSSCPMCGALCEGGVCSACGNKPDHCTCGPLDEELEYHDVQDENDEEEDDEEEDEQDEEEEDEDEDYDDYDYDEEDDKDW